MPTHSEDKYFIKIENKCLQETHLIKLIKKIYAIPQNIYALTSSVVCEGTSVKKFLE